ncbi:hypothetical protein HYT60_01850 [Candidatus Woesebacteria bacterium]|nr:hypothetical protein [Candidatus Woesebacteria bacterium]
MKESVNSKESVLAFERFIVSEYLRYGSVDEILRANRFKNLGVSYPGIYHILKRWGVVRSLGRASLPLTETLEFLVRAIEGKVPIQTLYRRMPPSFRPTLATVHRVYNETKKLVKQEVEIKERKRIRRVGTALVITPSWDSRQILVARDVSPAKGDIGKPYGSLSLPMGFSKMGEREKAILRVLQQEVFTGKLLESPAEFNKKALGFIDGSEPFMFIDIADVRVAVYHLELPRELSSLENFSSFKLKSFRFERVGEVLMMSQNRYLLRLGIEEIATGYLKYQERLTQATSEPFYMDSIFNRRLALLVAEEEAV